MKNIFITGNGTEVGKTVVSSIIVEALECDYWKPVQCGPTEDSDTQNVKHLLSNPTSKCHPSAYELPHPLSPHHAAQLAGITLDPTKLKIPTTHKHLIIEGCGGAMCPFNESTLLTDCFFQQCGWILISRHYLGSINHTLLTYEFLKQKQCNILGIIFNGPENSDSERFILNYTRLPCIARLYPEETISKSIIKRYSEIWKPQLTQMIAQH